MHSSFSFRRSLFALLVLFALGSLIFLAQKPVAITPTTPEYTYVSIGNTTIKAHVARTSEELTRGLGFRDFLAPDEGMWFDFGSADRFGIWMKDMKFSIDIIWLDENLRIVDLAERVSPGTYPRAFYPARDASFVLEVNAGTVEKYGWSIRDVATLQ